MVLQDFPPPADAVAISPAARLKFPRRQRRGLEFPRTTPASGGTPRALSSSDLVFA
jgi:hypothetical protein